VGGGTNDQPCNGDSSALRERVLAKALQRRPGGGGERETRAIFREKL